MTLRMASLFDGSGGFPLAAKNEGITPIWASEIEPFPIRVTTKRLPEVKHYGNGAEIDGSEVEPVDIITFGSPCQDMSVAGKRAGLKGSRSNLFYEAIRIIREMRIKTNGRYPRYIVWENVPGAFSSNRGEDFRCVLESICQIKDDWIAIPRPDKWNNAGNIMGDDYSVAWRVLDAQYWGVPQRRKRIFLVADLADRGGAAEVLFDCQSVQGNSEQSESKGKTTSETIGNSSDSSVRGVVFENHGQDSRYKQLDKAMTVTSTYGMGGNNQPFVVQPKAFRICSKDSNAMKSANPHSGFYETDKAATVDTSNQSPCKNQGYTVRRLTPTECARLQGFPDWWCSDLGTAEPTAEDIAFWRNVFETHRKIMGTSKKAKTDKQIVKWLKDPHTDSAEYKMWGNGVALPCVQFIMHQIAERDAEEEWHRQVMEEMTIQQLMEQEPELFEV